MFNINLKSVAKAFKTVGVGVAGVAVPAAFAFLENPEVFTPVVVALGPLGILAAPALVWVVAYGKDAWKHRNDPA